MRTEIRTEIHADSVRLDKWLWAARFFKTRSLATAAVERARVRQNAERVKPAHGVKVGDLLQIDNGATEWEVCVVALAELRGSAPMALALYRETEASIARRALLAQRRRESPEPTSMLKGRPTKRDRRLLDRTGGGE